MFALLDIERAGAGLHLLKRLQIPYEEGYLWYCFTKREFDLDDSAQNFVEGVAWTNSEESPTPEMPEEDEWLWSLAFSLGPPKLPFTREASKLTLEITKEQQTPLSEQARSRYVMAVITFYGEKHGDLLPPFHPAHNVMTAFLEAAQPVYSLAIGDTIWPSEAEDADFFREPWRKDDRYTNMYYGPELLPFIPPELLSPSAGLGHVERLGGGVWVTLPGWSTISFKVPDSIYEPHRAALGKINAALRQMPTPPWAEESGSPPPLPPLSSPT